MNAIIRNVLFAALLCLTVGSAYASVTVSLTSPTSGAVANANGSLTVSATAAAGQGYAVSKVEFFLGTTLIGTATSSPYSISWYVTQQPGNYLLTAKATATKGSSTQTATSSPVTVTVNGGPTVSVSVSPNQTAFAYPPAVSVTVTANVSDPDGISQVYLQYTGYFGESEAITLTQPPYTVTWELTPAFFPNYLPYSFAIDVMATDSRGASGFGGTTVVLTSPPTVSITAPTQNANFTPPASITVSAAAADSDGSVSKVEFFANGNAIGTATSAPFSINWVNVTAGTYNLTARATDDLGVQTTSAAVPIVVNTSPSITLTSPSPSTTFRAPANITLTAQASDNDGTLASVSFYNGSTLITTITTPPYTFNWTGVPQGAYTLTAAATDNVGATTISSPVVATVNAGVAQLYFISVDHLNTPRLVADATGTTVWRWDQEEPFGVNVADENPSMLGAFEFPLRFPGQYADNETNLHYNNFRDYESILGRYIQSDPLGLGGGIHTYFYVRNNPLSLTDPSGLYHETPGGDPYPGCGNDACCRAGICRPPQEDTELCCAEPEYTQCRNRVPGLARCTVMCALYRNPLACTACAAAYAAAAACASAHCKRIPRGQPCNPASKQSLACLHPSS